jgi:hypothetical protein
MTPPSSEKSNKVKGVMLRKEIIQIASDFWINRLKVWRRRRQQSIWIDS